MMFWAYRSFDTLWNLAGGLFELRLEFLFVNNYNFISRRAVWRKILYLDIIISNSYVQYTAKHLKCMTCSLEHRFFESHHTKDRIPLASPSVCKRGWRLAKLCPINQTGKRDYERNISWCPRRKQVILWWYASTPLTQSFSLLFLSHILTFIRRNGWSRIAFNVLVAIVHRRRIRSTRSHCRLAIRRNVSQPPFVTYTRER